MNDEAVRILVDAAMTLIDALEWHEALGAWVLRENGDTVRALLTLTVTAVGLRELQRRREGNDV